MRLDNLLGLAVSGLSSALWQYNHEYVNDYVDSLFSRGDVVFVSVESDGAVVKRKFRNGLNEDTIDARMASGDIIRKGSLIKYNDVHVGFVSPALSRKAGPLL